MESSYAEMKMTNFAEENEELIETMKEQANPMENEVAESDNICEMCFQNFASEDELNRHLSIHSFKQKIFQCSFCEKVSTTAQQLKNHERTHTKEKPYECAYCPKSFARICNLKQHELRHVSTESHECNICLKTFSIRDYFLRHVKAHAGEKRFKCDYCSKSFVTGQTKRIHERLHTGEKPFSCQSCPKTFSSLSSKNSHELTHALTKDYTCERCNKSFRNPYICKNHQKEGKCESAMMKLSNNLTEISKMEANEASKKMEADELSKKMEAHNEADRFIVINPKKYICDKCGIFFNRNHLLTAHKNKGTCIPTLKPISETLSTKNEDQSYPCDFCQKIFISSTLKSYHEATAHSSKQIICEKSKTGWKLTISLEK